MGAFLAFAIAVGALVLMVVGLIKPKALLRKAENPTRAQAAAPLAVLFALSVAVWVSLLPAAPVKGIGVSAPDMAGIFNAAGYNVVQVPDEGGEGHWLGQNGLAMVDIRGHAENVRYVDFRAVLIKGDDQGAKAHLLTMAALAGAVFPDWKEGGDWMAQAMKRGGETVYGGRRILLAYPADIGVQMTIQAE